MKLSTVAKYFVALSAVTVNVNGKTNCYSVKEKDASTATCADAKAAKDKTCVFCEKDRGKEWPKGFDKNHCINVKDSKKAGEILAWNQVPNMSEDDKKKYASKGYCSANGLMTASLVSAIAIVAIQKSD